MINFHKSQSPTTTFEILNHQLDIINSNILYLTHEIDQIKKIVMQTNNTVNLKQQVMDYYVTEDKPQEEDKETV